jgi:hypothetical protein
MVGCPIFPSILIAKYLFTGSLRERPFNLKGEGYVYFLKNILIPNVAEKNILILVEEKKI